MNKYINKISGEFSFDEVFTSSFMRQHTSFSDIKSFLLASPEKIVNADDLDNADEKLLDKFVSTQTKFSSWQAMLDEAVDELIVNRLDF